MGRQAPSGTGDDVTGGDQDLLFVGHGVEGCEALLRGVRSGFRVMRLQADGDALGQIARAVRGGPPVGSLHVLGHGEPGAMLLAGGRVDAEAVARDGEALSAIAASLSERAEVVLYGCSVAAGAAGRRFLELLEDRLQVPVIASDGPVGSPALGGSWELPGLPAGRLAFSAGARAGYAGLFASTTGTAGNDTLTGSAGGDDISGLDGNDILSALDGADSLFGGGGNDTLYGGGDADTIYGGTGNDFNYGASGDDIVYAEDGNDGVSGGDGDDTLFGGAGNDTIIGSTGNDRLSGGDGGDWVWGGAGADLEYGGAGSDTMSGGDANDTLYGEADNDTLSGFSGSDILYGGGGSDALRGGGNDDTLYGGDDADTLSGGGGNDLLSGGAGDDLIYGGGAAVDDTLVGGAGNDTLTGSASDFNLDTITDFATGDSIVVTGTDLSALNGTAASGTIDLGSGYSLTLTGITGANGTFGAVFSGGNTTITLAVPGGGGGGDSGGDSSGSVVVSDSSGDTTGGSRTVTNNGGTSGSAAIVQNTGNNNNVVTATLPPSVQITSEGPSTAQSGTTASDTLVNAIDVRNTAGESGSISGAQGFLNSLSPTTPLDVRTIVPSVVSGIATDDPIVITGTSNGSQSEAFVIDMRSITGKTLQVDNIEFVSVMGNATVTGGAGNNYAVGDDNAQFMSLGVGDDTLYGGGGADTIGSADGNDVLLGESGADVVNGGTGNDTLRGGTEADVVYGNQDADLLYGNQANDTLFGGQNGDTVFGGQDADVAYGNLGDDVLYGNLGGDALYGGQGNDVLYGGQSSTGVDVLVGGEGSDTLYGGDGADSLSGGGGSDLFVVAGSGGADTVAGFDGAGGDRVQIAGNANGTAIDSFAELQTAATDSSDGVVIVLGSGNSLKLMGVNAADLQADWFTFT